jgi:hypothetical protein
VLVNRKHYCEEDIQRCNCTYPNRIVSPRRKDEEIILPVGLGEII